MTFSSGTPTSQNTPHPTVDDSTTDVAKQQAGEVAAGATDAGKHVASVAGDQAQQVAGEAKNQAQDLLNQTRGELTAQASEQQKRVAGGLRALSDEFGSMAQRSENPGMATDLTRQAARHTESIASWLDDREPGQILDEVTRFARRKPGTFLALAAGAGLLAGRLGRGLTASNTGESTTQSNSPQIPANDYPTEQFAPLPTPAAGYGTPPQGYAPGNHSAPAAGPQDPASGHPDSPYTVPSTATPAAGYAQHPIPGVNP